MKLWEDGFDHYGTNINHLLDGSYAGIGAGVLSTAHPATGSYGLQIGGSANFDGSCIRWVLPAAVDKLGVAAHFYFAGLPTDNSSGTIFDFLTATPIHSQIAAVVDSNGAIRFYRGRNYQTLSGENGTLIAQSNPIIVANANNHIEVQAYIHASAGWVRVAVNGVHRFEATGLNTLFNTDKIVSVGQINGFTGSTGSANFYMDDYYIYDFTGNPAVDTDFCPTTDGSGKATNYIGELQVWPLFPNGDTASAAWQKSTGTTGYTLIDEHDPNDSTYIFSNAAGDLSEFDLDDLPPEITYIRGLGIHARMSKSDAGATMLKLGMKSVAATTDAPERPVTTVPTFWRDAIDVDPNSSARWTRSSLNAGKLRLTRSI